MGTFRCLVSKQTVNEYTGADLGTSTVSVWTLINTPVVAGSLSGTIVQEGVPIQTFEVDVDGSFVFSTSSNTIKVVSGMINLGTGVVKLVWTQAPGANYGVVTYTGLPVYRSVTMESFGVSCPPPFNALCNAGSTAMVAAVTVCDLNL